MAPSVAAAVPILQCLTPGLAAVYVLGSQARGHARADSDLDLAVATSRPVSATILQSAREAVETRIDRDIDLIDFSAASPIPAAQVLFEGRRVASLEPLVADLLEVRLMRDHADLEDRRRSIEEDAGLRGRVLAA